MLGPIHAAAAAAADALLQGPLDRHLDLEGADSETALYGAGGSLVTLYEWRGTRALLDEGTMSEAADLLRARVAGWLSAPGHALQVTFARDPAAGGGAVDAALAGAAGQIRAQKLDLEDVLESRRGKLAAAAAAEKTFLAVTTHPSSMTRREREEASSVLRGAAAGLPPMRDAQAPLKVAEAVRQTHVAVCDPLAADFAHAGQELVRLSAGEAASAIAGMISPGGESAGLSARFAGAPAPAAPGAGRRLRVAAMPETRAALTGRDYSALGAERLSWQLLRDHAAVEGGDIVRIGSTSFLPFDLALPPETLTPFSELVESTLSAGDPLRWRISFLIESGGWAGTVMKRMFSSFFTFLNRTRNGRIRDAFRELEAIDGSEETVVRFRACAAVWEEAGEEARLRRSAARLRSAIERWGNARAEALAGDPAACLFASLPGSGAAPTAPSAAAPLTDAIALLPLDRPASPWTSGALPLTTPDGRVWPYQPGSPLQDAWSDLLSGAPGSGKSVLLNALNSAVLLGGSGRDDPPPRVGIIDVGASSAGLTDMFREALPAAERDLSVCVRLRNIKEHAVNIFDTEIGARKPTPLARAFIVNFVRLLLDASPSGGELAGLIGAAVDQAYVSAAEGGRAKRWHEAADPEIDAALFDGGFNPDDSSTWWEAVDFLSDAGRWAAAARAQTQAVPLLSDLAAAANEPRVADNYRDMKLATGERAVDGLRRVLAEAAADWPLLSGPTRFSLGRARLRAVDLQDVTARSTEAVAVRRSALMYMLARHVCTEGFYITPEDVPPLNLRPSQAERLMRRAELARRTPKRLSIDELHRAGGLPGIVDQITTDIREGRKHNVQIALASQLLADFDERLVGMATGVWICRASESDITLAKDALRLSPASVRALRTSLTGPRPDGAPVFAALSAKGGDVRQLLIHRLGAAEVWAWSTTAEDVALRDEVTALLGPAEARQALALMFPGGSARREIRRRAELAGARGDAGGTIGLLAAETAAEWRRVRRPAARGSAA